MDSTIPENQQQWKQEKIESSESDAFRQNVLTNNKPAGVPEGNGGAVETVQAPRDDFKEGGGLKI